MQPYSQPWKVVFDRSPSSGESPNAESTAPTAADAGAESRTPPTVSSSIPTQSTPYGPGREAGSGADESGVEGSAGHILSFESGAASPAQPAPGIPASDTVEAIIKAAHILRGVLSEHFAEFGLSDIRYLVMKMIATADAGGCSQAQLAVHLQQSESSISTLIDRMRGDDLIYRLPSQIDRRKKVLMLSEKGQQMLARIEGCHERRMQYLIDKIGLHDAQQFAGEIQRVAQRLVKLSSENVLQNWPSAPTHEPFTAESYRKSA